MNIVTMTTNVHNLTSTKGNCDVLYVNVATKTTNVHNLTSSIGNCDVLYMNVATMNTHVTILLPLWVFVMSYT